MTGPAAAKVEVSGDRISITRRVTVTWPIGAGPGITVRKRIRNVPRDVPHRLSRATLTYTWHGDSWLPLVELMGREAIGTGWSRYENPITASSLNGYRTIVDALHADHAPHTRIALTETELAS